MNLHMKRLWQSLAGLPTWVKFWLVILASTNMASLAFLDTDTGLWTAASFMIVGMFNMPTMFVQGGLTRLLSLPHFVWVPLLIHLYSKLFGPYAMLHTGPEYILALSVFVVNSISLMFDTLESFRWLVGRREILGLRQS